MKKQLSILTCAILLSACGSSSGGSSDSSSVSSTPSSNNNVVTAGGSSDTNTSQNNSAANTQSPFYSLKGTGNIAFNNADNIHQITINGQDIDLATVNGANLSGWKTEGFGFIVGGNSSSRNISTYTASPNVTVGIVRSGGVFAFFNGKGTDVSQLPNGTVNYKITVNSATASGFSTGGGQISADFANKTLSGQFSNGLALKAKIEGNKFASENGAATEVKGGFFGENAKEIGGVYKTSDRVGAFVGKAQ